MLVAQSLGREVFVGRRLALAMRVLVARMVRRWVLVDRR
jgi:hypothetical protein